MRSYPRRSVLAALFALVPSFLVAGSALADKELGHTGVAGVHSLVDTSTNPGARCRYAEVTPAPSGVDRQFKLTRIVVSPPRIRAVAGQQTVGWRFIVQRSMNYKPWATTYASSINKQTATTTQYAAFSLKGINVNVPTSHAGQSPYYRYRVLVKMFWYKPSGAVQGTALHLVQWYRYVDYDRNASGDPISSNNKYPCSDWFASYV